MDKRLNAEDPKGPSQLEELQRLEAEATKGPWKQSEDMTVYSDTPPECVAGSIMPWDAALIVALRNAAPAIFAELRRLRRVEEAARREIDGSKGYCKSGACDHKGDRDSNGDLFDHCWLYDAVSALAARDGGEGEK